MKAHFRVYEIEHQGDVDASVEDLQKHGCTNIEVTEKNYDDESMAVKCDLPEGVTLRELESRLEHACL